MLVFVRVASILFFISTAATNHETLKISFGYRSLRPVREPEEEISNRAFTSPQYQLCPLLGSITGALLAHRLSNHGALSQGEVLPNHAVLDLRNLVHFVTAQASLNLNRMFVCPSEIIKSRAVEACLKVLCSTEGRISKERSLAITVEQYNVMQAFPFLNPYLNPAPKFKTCPPTFNFFGIDFQTNPSKYLPTLVDGIPTQIAKLKQLLVLAKVQPLVLPPPMSQNEEMYAEAALNGAIICSHVSKLFSQSGRMVQQSQPGTQDLTVFLSYFIGRIIRRLGVSSTNLAMRTHTIALKMSLYWIANNFEIVRKSSPFMLSITSVRNLGIWSYYPKAPRIMTNNQQVRTTGMYFQFHGINQNMEVTSKILEERINWFNLQGEIEHMFPQMERVVSQEIIKMEIVPVPGIPQHCICSERPDAVGTLPYPEDWSGTLLPSATPTENNAVLLGTLGVLLGVHGSGMMQQLGMITTGSDPGYVQLIDIQIYPILQDALQLLVNRIAENIPITSDQGFYIVNAAFKTTKLVFNLGNGSELLPTSTLVPLSLKKCNLLQFHPELSHVRFDLWAMPTQYKVIHLWVRPMLGVDIEKAMKARVKLIIENQFDSLLNLIVTVFKKRIPTLTLENLKYLPKQATKVFPWDPAEALSFLYDVPPTDGIFEPADQLLDSFRRPMNCPGHILCPPDNCLSPPCGRYVCSSEDPWCYYPEGITCPGSIACPMEIELFGRTEICPGDSTMCPIVQVNCPGRPDCPDEKTRCPGAPSCPLRIRCPGPFCPQKDLREPQTLLPCPHHPMCSKQPLPNKIVCRNGTCIYPTNEITSDNTIDGQNVTTNEPFITTVLPTEETVTPPESGSTVQDTTEDGEKTSTEAAEEETTTTESLQEGTTAGSEEEQETPTTEFMQEGTTAGSEEEETKTTEYMHEGTTVKPEEEEMTTTESMQEGTTVEPEEEETKTTGSMQEVTTVGTEEEDTTTTESMQEGTTVEPEEEDTTTESVVVEEQGVESTTEHDDISPTQKEPEDQGTTTERDGEEIITASPDTEYENVTSNSEDNHTTTEENTTQGEPEDQGSTTEPDAEEITTASPDTEYENVTSNSGVTTATPEKQDETDVPSNYEVSATSEAPEESSVGQDTTSEPETEDSTPESETGVSDSTDEQKGKDSIFSTETPPQVDEPPATPPSDGQGEEVELSTAATDKKEEEATTTEQGVEDSTSPEKNSEGESTTTEPEVEEESTTTPETQEDEKEPGIPLKGDFTAEINDTSLGVESTTEEGKDPSTAPSPQDEENEKYIQPGTDAILQEGADGESTTLGPDTEGEPIKPDESHESQVTTPKIESTTASPEIEDDVPTQTDSTAEDSNATAAPNETLESDPTTMAPEAEKDSESEERPGAHDESIDTTSGPQVDDSNIPTQTDTTIDDSNVPANTDETPEVESTTKPEEESATVQETGEEPSGHDEPLDTTSDPQVEDSTITPDTEDKKGEEVTTQTDSTDEGSNTPATTDETPEVESTKKPEEESATIQETGDGQYTTSVPEVENSTPALETQDDNKEENAPSNTESIPDGIDTTELPTTAPIGEPTTTAPEERTNPTNATKTPDGHIKVNVRPQLFERIGDEYVPIKTCDCVCNSESSMQGQTEEVGVRLFENSVFQKYVMKRPKERSFKKPFLTSAKKIPAVGKVKKQEKGGAARALKTTKGSRYIAPGTKKSVKAKDKTTEKGDHSLAVSLKEQKNSSIKKNPAEESRSLASGTKNSVKGKGKTTKEPSIAAVRRKPKKAPAKGSRFLAPGTKSANVTKGNMQGKGPVQSQKAGPPSKAKKVSNSPKAQVGRSMASSLQPPKEKLKKTQKETQRRRALTQGSASANVAKGKMQGKGQSKKAGPPRKANKVANSMEAQGERSMTSNLQPSKEKTKKAQKTQGGRALTQGSASANKKLQKVKTQSKGKGGRSLATRETNRPKKVEKQAKGANRSIPEESKKTEKDKNRESQEERLLEPATKKTSRRVKNRNGQGRGAITSATKRQHQRKEKQNGITKTTG